MSNVQTDNPTCLITGVAGFVGSHLAERLLSLNWQVVGVDNFFSGKRENISHLLTNPFFKFHQNSITEKGLLERLKRAYPSIKICFHLAAIVSVPYSMDHPEECFQVNCEATSTLLTESANLEVETFVFAGSAAEYGTEKRLPLLEQYATDETCHMSPYGRSKYLGSRLVANSHERPRGIVLRCFNIYGPRQDPASPYSGVISRFLQMARKRQPFTIFGDGNQTRDFIFVSDVVNAYLAAAGLESGYGEIPAGIYNVGSGTATSILELARAIQHLTEAPESFTFYPERAGDVRQSLAAIEAFTKVTQWQPTVELEEGLKRTWNWMRNRENSNHDR